MTTRSRVTRSVLTAVAVLTLALPAAEARTIRGTGGNDVLRGTPEADTISGFGGHDTITGAGGNDDLQGGEGNDKVGGGAGNDKVGGFRGNDVLTGGPGDDVLLGTDGDDRLNGGDGADHPQGGTGNDSIRGGPGRDELDGDIGNDFVDAGPGDDSCPGFDEDSVALQCLGTEGRQTAVNVTGDAGDDVIYPGTGVDNVFGEEGDDLVVVADDGVYDRIYCRDAQSEPDAVGNGGTVVFVGGVDRLDDLRFCDTRVMTAEEFRAEYPKLPLP